MKKDEKKEKHQPVLVDQVKQLLQVEEKARLKQARFIDATVGFGGHAIEMIKAGAWVLGIDNDTHALKIAKKNMLLACPPRQDNLAGFFKVIHGNFKDIDKIARSQKIDAVDGVLFDLGVNSFQLTSKKRGFSFQTARSMLDMRVDVNNQAVTAAMLLNALNKPQLMNLFEPVLGYKKSISLVDKIIKKRVEKSFARVIDLLDILPKKKKGEKVHPATKVFLALRIAVNSELENLKIALPKAFRLLNDKGRLAVISFHSAEDVLVKDFFKQLDKSNQAVIVNKKPITPAVEETKDNPRSRSAKLRVIERKVI